MAADQAGLDVAIEAAIRPTRDAFYDSMAAQGSHSREPVIAAVVAAAVHAAAPYIRAAALIEAADELDAQATAAGQSVMAAWLRERAERETARG